MTKLLELAARGKKFIAGLVGAVIGAGGVAVLFPDLSTPWATLVTGTLAALAVLVGPANAPKTPPPVDPIYAEDVKRA